MFFTIYLAMLKKAYFQMTWGVDTTIPAWGSPRMVFFCRRVKTLTVMGKRPNIKIPFSPQKFPYCFGKHLRTLEYNYFQKNLRLTMYIKKKPGLPKIF